MKRIHDWLEYIERSRPFRVYWKSDARNTQRHREDLDKITARDFALPELIADAEWVGHRDGKRSRSRPARRAAAV